MIYFKNNFSGADLYAHVLLLLVVLFWHILFCENFNDLTGTFADFESCNVFTLQHSFKIILASLW